MENRGFERELRFNREIVLVYKERMAKPEDFVAAGAISPLEVERDNQEIHKIKAGRERSRSAEPTALEYALIKMLDDGMFGDAVKFVEKASAYDDTKRNIDFYVDLGEGKEVVALGIDATTNTDPGTLAANLRRSVQAVRRDTLPKVKYFHNGVEAGGDPRKEYMANMAMPRVVLCVDAERTARLEEELLSGQETAERNLVPLLLEQIMGQLSLLEQEAPPGSFSRKRIARVKGRIEEIYKEKSLRREELAQAFGSDPLVNPEILFPRDGEPAAPAA